MSNKNHSISLILIGLLLITAASEVFAGLSADIEQSKLKVISLIQDSNNTNVEAQTQKLLADFSGHKDIAQAVWQIAKEYEKPKKYDKAFELHQYNIQRYPNDMYAMWSQVEIIYSHIKEGDYVAADTAFNTLLTAFSQQPTLPKEIYQIAMRYDELNRYDKAVGLHQYNAERFSRDDMYAMWSKVEVIKSHFRKKDDAAVDAAVDSFLTAFSKQPAFPKEVYILAKRYYELERYDRTMKLHQYNAEHSSREDMYTMWSQVEVIKSHIRQKDDAAADAAFNRLITEFYQQPTISKEIYEVADEYGRAGKKDKAEQLYKYVVNDFPGSTGEMWVKASIARLDIKLGNEAAAGEMLNNLTSNFRENSGLPQLIFRIGEEYYSKASQLEDEGLTTEARDNLEKSLAIWKRIIEELPKSNPMITAHAYYSSADCYRRLAQHSKAVEYYQMVVDNWPDFEYAWNAQFTIGLIYEGLKKSGDISKSEVDMKIRAAYEQLLERYPDCKTAKIARRWLNRHNSSN